MGVKKALCLGAGGFIFHNMTSKLKDLGYWVRAVDLKYPEFEKTKADEFIIGDLRNKNFTQDVMCIKGGYDYVFQGACDMGGSKYIFSGDYDADVMSNSQQINLNVAEASVTCNVKKLLFTSSACIYPEYNQLDPDNPICSESSAYPVAPESEYGYEKIFSERLYDSYRRNYGLNIRVARLHNIFGENSDYKTIKAKAPAGLTYKVISAKDGSEVIVDGDGKQTRSFLYIEECLTGLLKLMESDWYQPINIGSEEMISINNLTQMIIDISGKDLKIKNVPSKTTGVRGRNSDNKLCREVLNWSPFQPLKAGMEKLYLWIDAQVNHLDSSW